MGLTATKKIPARLRGATIGTLRAYLQELINGNGIVRIAERSFRSRSQATVFWIMTTGKVTFDGQDERSPFRENKGASIRVIKKVARNGQECATLTPDVMRAYLMERRRSLLTELQAANVALGYDPQAAFTVK